MIFEKFSEEVISVVEVEMMELSASFRPIKAIHVISFPFLWVCEVFVGLRDLSKLLESFIAVVGIFIRMPLDCQLFVCFFDIGLRCFFVHSQ